jgi:pantetheine-phosphate adenylyltransferase
MYKVTKRNRLTALGGTFDHFHIGHQSFIDYAFKYGYRLIIGITDDKFTRTKDFPQSMQPYKVRAKAVHNYCKKNNILHEIVPLSDPYGPTIDRENRKIDSLCVTEETMPGAEKIGEIRKVSGMRELTVMIAPLVNNELGQPLHAIQIRSGKTNRWGKSYSKLFSKDIEINKAQRSFLSKPLGPITKAATHKKNTIVAVVGDYALNQFIEKKWIYTIGVFDKLTQREPYGTKHLDELTPDVEIDNPAGLISLDSLKKVDLIDFSDNENKKHILVNGEEDLVTIPLILLMPLNSLIYYGQPNEGMVLLKVTEDLKEKISKLLFQ